MRSQPTLQEKHETASPTSPVLLHAIHPINLLSFGPDTPEIPLEPLNLLIGPNGSGKSNLIEVIALLRSTSTDISDLIRRGGGVREWIWKGSPKSAASLEVTIADPDAIMSLRHFFAFQPNDQTFRLSDEQITNAWTLTGDTKPVTHYALSESMARVPGGTGSLGGFGGGGFSTYIDTASSVLKQLRDPLNHPSITYLTTQYEKIRLYREWAFGRNTVFRAPQRADMRNDRLEEDFSNLGLFLNRLRRHPHTKKAILGHLRDIYEGVDDFDVSVEGGTVQVFFTEGDFTIPATRLSDGTLRYLCLLAILCDPTPPPLICIEEPELGLHPDILPKIADLLVEASARTQLIVTTHSDILVDAMTERPEVVLVCEKHNGQTQIQRLAKEDLAVWLEKYRLGELWTRGDIGGTRW